MDCNLPATACTAPSVAKLLGMQLSDEPDAVFMPRAFVQATIPHRRPRELYFRRRNGNLTLTMVGHPNYGLPYGKVPRLLLAWMTRQAKRTHSRQLQLPASERALLRELGCTSTGGANGSLSAFHEQAMRLATVTVHFDWQCDGNAVWQPHPIASGACLWWNRTNGNRDRECWIELDARFYEAIERSVIPVDLRMLIALRSPLAIDLYAWLCYRTYRLPRDQLIPWAALQAQFGADYSEPRYFRRAALRQLKHIYDAWPDLRVTPEVDGLRLHKCRPHVAPRAVPSRLQLY